MTKQYQLQNQRGELLEKSGEWLPPTSAKNPYQTPHKDEAINLKVELAVRQPELRVMLVTVEINAAVPVSPDPALSDI